MSDELLEELLQDFRSRYPNFLKENYVNGFTDDEIKAKMLSIYDTINTKCRFWRKILYLLTLHNLINEPKTIDDAKSIDTADIKMLKTGDITTQSGDSGGIGNYDPLTYGTVFGYEAKQLLRKCARGMIGIIR